MKIFIYGLLIGAGIVFFIRHPERAVTKEVTIVTEEKRCAELNGRFDVYRDYLNDKINITCYSESKNLFKY